LTSLVYDDNVKGALGDEGVVGGQARDGYYGALEHLLEAPCGGVWVPGGNIEKSNI
jgi:hypothetical protein